jgi:hypothetical protein
MPHATINEKDERILDPLATALESLTTIERPFNDDENQLNRIHEEQNEPQVPRDVSTTLHYLSSNTSLSKPPIQVVTRAATTHDPRTSVKLSQGPSETVYDVRGNESNFSLSKNGFAFLKHKSVTGELESRDRIWKEYVEGECREVVARAFGGREGGVDEVIAFHEGVSEAANQ